MSIEIHPDDDAFKVTGTEARVVEDIARRQQRGIQKYGTTVADNPIAIRDWLQHFYEELLDGAVYAKRSIEELASAKHSREIEQAHIQVARVELMTRINDLASEHPEKAVVAQRMHYLVDVIVGESK